MAEAAQGDTVFMKLRRNTASTLASASLIDKTLQQCLAEQ
jgi:hypothetical protein